MQRPLRPVRFPFYFRMHQVLSQQVRIAYSSAYSELTHWPNRLILSQCVDTNSAIVCATVCIPNYCRYSFRLETRYICRCPNTLRGIWRTDKSSGIMHSGGAVCRDRRWNSFIKSHVVCVYSFFSFLPRSSSKNDRSNL